MTARPADAHFTRKMTANCPHVIAGRVGDRIVRDGYVRSMFIRRNAVTKPLWKLNVAYPKISFASEGSVMVAEVVFMTRFSCPHCSQSGMFWNTAGRLPAVSNGFHLEHGRQGTLVLPLVVCDHCDECQDPRPAG
jgi:hypothetical protein